VLARLLLLFTPQARALSPAEADAAFDAFNTAYYVVSSGPGYYKADTGGGPLFALNETGAGLPRRPPCLC